MRVPKILLFPCVLSLIFCTVYILSNRQPELFMYGFELMEFGNALAVSIIAAFIFYFFQIYIPLRTAVDRHKLIITNYQKSILHIIVDVAYLNMIDNKQYDSLDIDPVIKEGLQRTDKILLTNLQYLTELEKDLIYPEKFKSFFRLEAGESQKMWDRFKNGIEEDSNQRKQLLILLDLVQQITKDLMSKVDLEEQHYNYLFKLSESIFWLQKADFNQEDAKPLFDFLWELFMGDNFWNGLDQKNALINWIRNL